MFERLEISREAYALATHAMTRQAAISANVANADTPKYQATDLPDFAAVYGTDDGFQPLATRTRHLARPSSGQTFELAARTIPGNQSPNGNTVSLETELMKGAEVRQAYDLALAIAKSAGSIVRSSLGRR